MFDKTFIPQQNAQMKQYLTNLYNQAPANAQQKAAIEKKMEKVDDSLKQKIVQTITVSAYFDHLWKQGDLKDNHKEFVIKKVEAIKEITKKQIINGQQHIGKEPTNLDVFNTEFKMSPFEEFNYNERLKNIKKQNKLDIESDLFKNHTREVDILNALNRPTRLNAHTSYPSSLHYTAGLCEVEEADNVKAMKAEGFVKKIQDEKKAFKKKLRQKEKSAEQRDLEELERFRKNQQEEEERRQQEKKKQLDMHIKELKSRSEVRLKETAKWEEDYKAHLGKKPMFKEIESKFKKGFVIPELEERKKKLQEIRDFHKPIGLQELKEHEQKVLKIFEERQEEKRQQLENPTWNYKKPEYESRHHKVFAEELTKARRTKEDGQMDLLKRKEKVMELLQDVKDNHLPKVDAQKEMERINLIEKLKKKEGKTRFNNDEGESIDHKKLGGEYLKSVKELVQKIKRENPNIGKPKESDYNSQGKKSEVHTSNDNKLIPSTTKSEGSLIKKTNYLVDLRRENKIPNKNNQVEMIIKNKKLDQNERNVLLRSEIEKLEEKAKRKETIKKFKAKRNGEDGKNDDDDDEVEQIYINAIRAKLEMLAH